MEKKYKPRRGRPSPEQVVALEDGLLGAARFLFLEHGYAATSMDAVVARLGVSKATLYSRYSTKADLFDAIVNDRLRVWGDQASDYRLDEQVPLAEHLHRYGTSFLTELRKPERLAFHQLIKSESARFPELTKKFYSQGFASAVEHLAQILNESSKEGWPLKNPTALARAYLSSLLGWFDIALIEQSVSDNRCRDAVSYYTEIFIGGRSAW